MTKRYRLIFVLLTVVMIGIFGMSIGMTAAIWTSVGANAGSNTVAPAVDSPEDWNSWIKYFDGIVINESSLEISLTSFYSDGATLNLERVIMPSYLSVDGKTYTVVEIGNGLFANTTLNELPTVIYISPYVRHINTSAFMNLPNLTKVVFGVDSTGSGAECIIDDYAFAMCAKLSQIVANGRALKDSGGNAISAQSSAFMGCADTLTVS